MRCSTPPVATTRPWMRRALRPVSPRRRASPATPCGRAGETMRGKQDSCGRADQAMGGKVESQLITPSPLPPLPRSLEELAENQPGPADIWAAAAHASSAQRFSGGDGSRRGGGRWAPGRNPYASAAPARSTPALAPARDRASTLPPSQNDVLMLPRKAASEVDPALLALADPRTGGAWVSNRELKLAPNSLVYGRRRRRGAGRGAAGLPRVPQLHVHCGRRQRHRRRLVCERRRRLGGRRRQQRGRGGGWRRRRQG